MLTSGREPADNATSAGSCGSSLNCEMLTALSTFKILSLTRRSGSLTEHRSVASQFPWLVTHEVINTGPSIAEITSRSLICYGSFAN